jgi:hypothetical protein
LKGVLASNALQSILSTRTPQNGHSNTMTSTVGDSALFFKNFVGLSINLIFMPITQVRFCRIQNI